MDSSSATARLKPVNKGDVPRQSICFNGCLDLRVLTRQMGWDITPGKSKNNVKTVATLRMNRTPQCRNQVSWPIKRPYAEYAYPEDSCHRQRVQLTKLHLFKGIRLAVDGSCGERLPLLLGANTIWWHQLTWSGFAVKNSFLSTIEPHVCL